jgi:hypothetical protein
LASQSAFSPAIFLFVNAASTFLSCSLFFVARCLKLSADNHYFPDVSQDAERCIDGGIIKLQAGTDGGQVPGIGQ